MHVPDALVHPTWSLFGFVKARVSFSEPDQSFVSQTPILLTCSDQTITLDCLAPLSHKWPHLSVAATGSLQSFGVLSPCLKIETNIPCHE